MEHLVDGTKEGKFGFEDGTIHKMEKSKNDQFSTFVVVTTIQAGISSHSVSALLAFLPQPAPNN